jgi:hypothetical protein
LAERDLTPREVAFWTLVRSSNLHDAEEREASMRNVSAELTDDEIYLGSLVISLFQFYNSFVDLNGVAELTPDGYEASGVRLATHGYAPPPKSS